MYLYIILLCVVLCMGFTRCILCNLHNIGYYGIKDILDYFIYRKYKQFNLYGIDMFVGMFGHGKTLSMTHKAKFLYDKFGDSLLFLSNYELKDIPYVPLTNFNQIVEIGNMETKKQGTVILIDEIEDVLSHRNYASFPLAMLHTLTQQRKKKVYIMCTAQRFFMVDKLFRAITTHVIDCNKYWRLQHMTYFDAWDYENAMNSQLLSSIFNQWWFVKDKDFACYNTEQMISNDMASEFISNDETLVRKGLDAMANENAIKKPSKRLRNVRKRSKK